LGATIAYNIVLIIADAYRFDCLSVFNPQYPFTPRLHHRMRSWYQFPLCFSSAPWTLPSCSSILAGVHSSTHGYYFHNRSFGRPTLARYLDRQFYKIGIVNNGNLREFSGLHEGFDEYHYFDSHDEPYTKAQEFLLSRRREEPYFLFFHTNIPHDYFKEDCRQYYRLCFPERNDWYSLEPRVVSWSGLSPDQRAMVRSFYDACVSRMDQKLAELLDLIDQDRTIICFLADHGEGLDYDTARLHHGGRLHNDLINVPLLIHLPPCAPATHHASLSANQRSSLSTSDLAPTLLELCGCPVPQGLDGKSILELSPQLHRCLPSEDRRYLYGPTRERFNVNLEGKNTSWSSRIKNFLGQITVARGFNLKGYVEYPYKLIITSYARSPIIPPWLMFKVLRKYLFFPTAELVCHQNLVVSLELFDLEKDPCERQNLLYGGSPDSFKDFIGERMKGFPDMSITVMGREYSLKRLLQPF
jgi:arylsulfatase A-like enzyme